MVCTAPGWAALDRPAELERDITFWTRVFTEITNDQGFVHDDTRLDIVYATVALREPGTSAQRASRADLEARRYIAALKSLANGKRTGLTATETQVLSQWGADVDNATLRAASGRVRVQRGQADKFREGLVRSGAWEAHIERALKASRVPPELIALPHVESSFNPLARSHVGAAGMWQFMASTGRRYMQIDNVVDERMDPHRSSDAAALLFRQNYEVTGTWPLAITAYNHGAGGMRRAAKQVGTTDIARVLREYKARTFGFASRNFYVAFLAASDARTDSERYFGKLQRDPPDQNPTIDLPGYAAIDDLVVALGVDRAELVRLNPSLRPSVIDGHKFIPRGYTLRLPQRDGVDAQQWLAAVPSELWLTAQVPDLYHVVQRGETLSSIAPRYGARVNDLVSINSLGSANRIREGQKLILPAALVASEPAVADGVYPTPEVAVEAPSEVESVVAAVAIEPMVEVAEAAPRTSPITQGEESAPAADPNDYSVAADDTIRIQEGEALVHFAAWSEVDPAVLKSLNGLKSGARIRSGGTFKLRFDRVTPDVFLSRRLDHHRELQERFFARYRIAGTNEHVVRSGESVWVLAERRYKVPIWLLRQYNPDLDLAVVRPGTRVVIPLLESRQA
ncbi:MAG: transglycosylase SLT domain-containing protein [Gammaproteobacteria bacterium]|nr:transglycosylase SLT domain-containing protein [Gammaproteobacteria bacterium]